MRFREDLKAYYFSTNHETDSEERSIIYEQTKDYLKEYLHTTFKPADTTGGTVKKFLPIVIFAIAVVLLINKQDDSRSDIYIWRSVHSLRHSFLPAGQ